ncbi:hypothetical protein L211DRAFT_857828 [Terfezia boudieri ATCC MYA-4762]|uniref:E3 ubiquitin-protein ligase PEP5 n=1 Tax=Terfezia boudieri ATCC MYA-4762 TaxID=1051890 RepID=A0A3N4LJL0_9PEZI|nr:hypothetical protein L211DRAFT_857828 [Terfezia boudieri ATCC MYA-4762]
MALASWKSFPFFNVTRVNPHDENPKIFEGDIRSIASSFLNLFLGTGDGHVQILSSSFKLVRTLAAYLQHSAVSHLQQVEGTSLLVTIGEDLSSEAILKVWALDQTDKKTSAPKYLSTVTAMAITTPTLNPVAVAFANGSLTLIRGDLIHDRGAKQRIGETRLWISTTIRLLCMHIDGSPGIMGARLGIGGGAIGGSQNDVRVVDAQGGVGVGCMIGVPTKEATSISIGEVVVVRDDAIYFYSSTGGKGGCYAYEGAKSRVYIYKNYMTLVSPSQSAPSSGTGGSIGGALKKMVGGAIGSNRGELVDWDVTRFTIVDTEGKYLAAQEVVVGSGGAGGVRGVFELGDFLWVLGLDGKLWRYQEKDLTAKLNLLYACNLYLLAISLASKSPSIEPQRLNSIFRKYADYLYAKQDFDGAMQWYIKALGDEPSAEVSGVIKKFLDTQRIGNLIEYLEELHKRDGAGVDHTTLLVSCYAKGRDMEKLEKFIKSTDGTKGETYIVVSILVENLEKYSDALDYLSSLEPGRAYPNLMKYARLLLKHIPQETTRFFVRYYTGKFVPRKQPEEFETSKAAPADTAATFPLQAEAPTVPISVSTLPSTMGSQTDEPEYILPQPRTAFSSFIENPREFIEFLESLLEMENTSNILLLSHLSNFSDGTVLVREKQGLRFDIFRSCTSARDTKGALEALRKYRPEEPQLYTAALAYFTSSAQVLNEVGEEELKNVLKKIDELGLMKPLQVVQTLSVNVVATVGMVKKYLGETIQKERKEIQANRRLIESYKTDTESKQKEIADLASKPVTFQAQRCQACRMQLDMPIVHFLCKHSFHQRCLNQVNGDFECPNCQANTETIRAIWRTQDEQADRHDLFKAALADSKDKFATISEWFGRGVMVSPPTVEG